MVASLRWRRIQSLKICVLCVFASLSDRDPILLSAEVVCVYFASRDCRFASWLPCGGFPFIKGEVFQSTLTVHDLSDYLANYLKVFVYTTGISLIVGLSKYFERVCPYYKGAGSSPRLSVVMPAVSRFWGCSGSVT